MAKTRKLSTQKTRKPKLKRSRGALTALAMLMGLSAFVRLGEQAGQAWARESAALLQPDAVTDMPLPEPMAPPPDIQMVLDALKVREDRVSEAERQMRLRMVALQEADLEIERRLQDLIQAENALRETLALADAAADKDIDRLVAVYENMKPKEAADLFETMQPSFAAGFLGRMNPQAAAGIMAGLAPDTAHAISVELAGRNADVPTQ